jgi:hypothetical protein
MESKTTVKLPSALAAYPLKGITQQFSSICRIWFFDDLAQKATKKAIEPSWVGLSPTTHQ